MYILSHLLSITLAILEHRTNQAAAINPVFEDEAISSRQSLSITKISKHQILKGWPTYARGVSIERVQICSIDTVFGPSLAHSQFKPYEIFRTLVVCTIDNISCTFLYFFGSHSPWIRGVVYNPSVKSTYLSLNRPLVKDTSPQAHGNLRTLISSALISLEFVTISLVFSLHRLLSSNQNRQRLDRSYKTNTL